MLAPDSRAVLLQQLKPDAGFEFDAAIATTFTLDLTATLIPALAFSSLSFHGSVPDPIAAMEAIRSTADRMDVFCQAGSVGIPGKAPDLLAFLEPMVHEVRRPPGGLFHPKLWFVRYAGEDGTRAYRLLVLTRNLTHDNSWDVVARLDSEAARRRRRPENRPLADFLADLPGRCLKALRSERADRIAGLADEARRIEWRRPDTVEEVAFHYLDGSGPSGVDFTGRRHLVVSPFVNDAGLDLVADEMPITIVSRPEELERLSPDTVPRLEAFVVDTMAGVTDDDNKDEPAAADRPGSLTVGLLGDLHAKMFVIEPHGRAHTARLLVGSANATDAAFQANVEFLVEFRGPRRHLGIDGFVGNDAPFRALLEEYQPVGGAMIDPQEEERRQVENALRRVAELQHTVTVLPSTTPETSPRHELAVSSDRAYDLRDPWDVSIELLTLPGTARQVAHNAPVEVVFGGVATADVTPFVVVRITTPSGLTCGTVVVANLVGDPSDRLDLVLARQIDTPEKFLRFLYLLLSLGDSQLLTLLLSGSNGEGEGSQVRFGPGPGVLELVLRALADRPTALDHLDRLVRRLQATDRGSDVLPKGFDELWEVVRKAQRRLVKAGK